jgi:hypothetical protein
VRSSRLRHSSNLDVAAPSATLKGMSGSKIIRLGGSLVAVGLGLAACGSSGHPVAKSTTTTSASASSPTTRGKTPPTPPTTAPAQVHTSTTPKTLANGGAACLAAGKVTNGHLAVTVTVAGPALVQVSAPGASPGTEDAVVDAGSDGVTVYMNTSSKVNAQVVVVKNRISSGCTAPVS